MTYYYILNGHVAVPASIDQWASWFESADRSVKKSRATVKLEGNPLGFVEISTVFLGINRQFGDGPPLLFETMVFGGPLDGQTDRCSTWEAAEKMHEAMCERVKLAAKEVP